MWFRLPLHRAVVMAVAFALLLAPTSGRAACCGDAQSSGCCQTAPAKRTCCKPNAHQCGCPCATPVGSHTGRMTCHDGHCLCQPGESKPVTPPVAGNSVSHVDLTGPVLFVAAFVPSAPVVPLADPPLLFESTDRLAMHCVWRK